MEGDSMTERQVERFIKQCARDGKTPEQALSDLCDLLGFKYNDYYPNSGLDINSDNNLV